MTHIKSIIILYRNQYFNTGNKQICHGDTYIERRVKDQKTSWQYHKQNNTGHWPFLMILGLASVY